MTGRQKKKNHAARKPKAERQPYQIERDLQEEGEAAGPRAVAKAADGPIADKLGQPGLFDSEVEASTDGSGKTRIRFGVSIRADDGRLSRLGLGAIVVCVGVVFVILAGFLAALHQSAILPMCAAMGCVVLGAGLGACDSILRWRNAKEGAAATPAVVIAEVTGPASEQMLLNTTAGLGAFEPDRGRQLEGHRSSPASETLEGTEPQPR